MLLFIATLGGLLLMMGHHSQKTIECASPRKLCMAASLAVTALDLEERATHKIRVRTIPFLFVLFVINYIDRVNIGFAALTMNKELALTSQQYGFIAGIFFFGYFIFEVPSNLLLHRLGARVWIARILVSWGIVAVLTGFVRTAFQLSALRFLPMHRPIQPPELGRVAGAPKSAGSSTGINAVQP